MKENNEGGDSENNEDDTVENVNVEREMAGLIDIFNEQKKRQETKNVLTTENSEAVTEKKSSKRYQEKVQALQKYIPALQRVMDNIEPGPNMEVQNSCRQKLEILYSMMEQPKKDKPLKYECLEKLERILCTIASRVKVKKSSRAGSPSLKSLLAEDDEDSQSPANKAQPGPSGMEVKWPNTEKSSRIKKYKLVTKVNGKNATNSVGKVKGGKKTEKVPNNSCLFPSIKSVVNKKDISKNIENNFDLLFTPDPNVSKIRPGTSSDYPRSFTESGTRRPRFPYSGRETRPAHSFTPREERIRFPYPDSTRRFRAPYPDSSEIYRAPYPESTGRLRAPYPDSSEIYRAPYPESTGRLRAPYPDSSEIYRAPYPESTGRLRAPYPDSTEIYRAPYPVSTEIYRAPYLDSTGRLRAPYPDSTQRYRAPYPDSTEIYRAPYPDSTEIYRAPYPDSTERYRAHYDSSEIYRAPYPESGIRYRTPYNDSEIRYRAPYNDMDKHRPAFTDIEERYYEKPKSGKKIDKAEADTSESSRLRLREKSDASSSFTLTKSGKERKLDRSETDTNQSFGSRAHEKSAPSKKSSNERKLDRSETDTNQSFGSRAHEKSAPSKKSSNEKNIDRLAETNITESSKSRPHEKSVASSSSSILTKSSKKRRREKSEGDSAEPPNRKLKVKHPNGSTSGLSSSDINIERRREKSEGDSAEPPNRKLKVKHPNGSTSGLSSSDINIESSLSSSNVLDNMDDLGMQQKDLEKLTQSAQQLKSHLNNRLKNMQAQRLLIASTNKDVTTTCRDSTTKNTEVSGGSREEKYITPEKSVRSRDELQTEPTNEEANAFIDNLMSNLTTKFGLKRGSITANEQQEKSTNKPETTVVCRSNASEKKESEILETNGHETNFNMIRKPLLSAEDRAEVISTVKRILLEKAKSLNPIPTVNNSTPTVNNSTPTVNLDTEKQTSLPSVRNNDSLKIPTIELTTGHEWTESKTIPNVPNADDNNCNNINIPGLDGIIPLVLERSSASFYESMSNKTKDHPLVTKVLKGLVNQSSQENCIKSKSSETVQGGDVMSAKPIFNLNENVGDLKQNQKLNSNLNEDTNKFKPNQSLKSKLIGEISTLHKVGTPCGGALRGLVKRDKMMPSGQVASLKPGALYDLISEDKHSWSTTKAKIRPQLQPNSINNAHVSVNISSETLKIPICSDEMENSCLSGKTKNPDDILSKLSEEDLKNIITANIWDLPTPPNLAFLNNAVSTRVSSDISMNVNSQSSGISWNNQGSSMHHINMHTQNVHINNINVPPVDNTSNNNLINQQSGSNWAKSDINDAWKNNTHMKDPWRESQLANNVTLPSHQSMESGQNLFSPVPDAVASSFEKPTYSSSCVKNTEPFKGNERETSRDPFYFNSFNPPVVLQTDPHTSPCYDGSANPDPYRPDPYTMSLNSSFEKQGQVCNDSTEQLNVFSRPSLLGDSPTTFESHANFGREITQRPPLLRTPPPLVPRPSLLGTPSLSQERELYSNFDSQQSRYNDPRNIRCAPSTYTGWQAGNNIAEGRNINSFQLCDGPNYHNDKTIDDHRNFNRYRWTRETASSSYDHRGSNYNDASCRTQPKESDVVKKLSARDPRRKSIEDGSERKESLPASTSYSKIESNNQDWCSSKSVKLNGMDQLGNVPKSTATTLNGMDQLGNVPKSTATTENIRGRSSQRDPRTRERTPPRGRSGSRAPRGRSGSRDQGRHYRSRGRSLSRGPNRGRSPSRRSDDLTNKLHRNEKNKDTYSSPLDQLYANTSVPKTGLGYGFQKFRIPRWNKGSFDHSSKAQTKESHCGKDSSKDHQKSKNSSDRELEIQNVEIEAHQATSESAEEVVNALKKEKSYQKKDIDIQPTTSGSNEKDIQNDCQSAVEQLPENIGKEKKEEPKLNTRSRNKEIKKSSKIVSAEEELEQSPCRRSKRLIKKKRGRPPKAKSLKKQFEVEEQESSSDTNHLPSSNDVEDKNDGYEMTFTDHSTELKSSSDNEKSKRSAAKGKTGLKNIQASPEESNKSKTLEEKSDTEENQSKLLFNTNVEISNSEVKNKYATVSESSLDQTVQLLESAINRTEEISGPSTPSDDLPLPTKSCNNHENFSGNVSIVQLSQKIDNMGTPDLTNGVKNAEIVEFSGKNTSDNTVKTIAKISEGNPPPSGGSQIQTLIKIPETANISSEIATEVTKESTPSPCDSVNTGPEIKIIKQVELLQDVIGIKLTPDKIRKMAEILYVPELKENMKEEQLQEKTISDANKSVKVVTSDVKSEDNSNEINKTLCELQKVEFNDQKTLIKHEKQFETTTVSDTDDGQEVVKSSKAKVLKKRKSNTSRNQIPKKDFVNENATTKPKRKYKNELDRLQDDISKYHDSEAIAAASGPRQCRLQKEKNQSIGKIPQVKPTQKVKKNHKKCKEDEFDDSEGASIKDGSSKCQEDELDELEEDSMQEESDDEVKEDKASTEGESIEKKYYQSYSSSDDDPIHLYTEKMRSKYRFVLQEAKGEQSSNDVNSRKSKDNSEAALITSSVNTKYSECQKPVSNENDGSNDRSVQEKAGSDSGNKSGNDQVKGSGEHNQFEFEKCAENLPDPESNFGKEEKPNKVLTNNILQKYALKKQRKKSFWSAGIIRKKTKSKKTDSPVSSPNEDNIDTSGLDMEDEEDIVVNDAPDLNYYQEGDSKATKCKLCSFYGKSIVTHYAITHPKDEVLISRMSPKAAEITIKESGHFFSLSDKKKNDYSSLFECRICYMKFCKFSSFFEHMALHTGEFRHECCKCGYRTSTRGGILKHYQSHNVKNANNKSCRVLYKEPVDKTFFCGYLCSLCNYFQISQKNVKRHVENVHEIQDFNHVVKINFSKVTFNESDYEFVKNDVSSANNISGKALGMKQTGESSNKVTFDTGPEEEVTSGNQLLSKTCSILQVNGSSDGEAPENSRKPSKSNSEGSLSDTLQNNTTESITNYVCSVGDSRYTDSKSLNKDTQDIADLKKSLISQDVASASQNTKYPDIINNAQNTIENCDSNIDAKISKERVVSTLINNVEDTSGIRKDLVSDSMQKGARDLCLEKNTHDATTGIVDNCSADVDASGMPIISNANKETPLMADTKKTFNDVGNPDKEKEQAPMLIQNDWFLSLCNNISEINYRYLIESANASVSSSVENLKFKVNSPSIADVVSRRCVSDVENALPLNDFLQMSVSFKVERKGNVSSEKCYETLNQKNATENEVEETTPARRQLPERTCKGVFTKQVGDKERDHELSSDDEDEVDIYKVVKDAGHHEDNWDDDVIVKEEIVPETFPDRSSTIATENNSQSLPCLQAPVQNYLTKNASRKPLSIQDKVYISSLPPNSNFSEFTHVMKQISQVSLKVSEIKEVKVGGLKAHPDGCGVIFSCSVKIFNKECGFQTSDLEAFGQHVNMSHHTSHWNGVCCSCVFHFVRDPNSHDKVSVNTQSKAFCHLVREHLTFMKKTTKSATRRSLTSNEAPVSEEAPPPRLRVRRFSGDKLSGTDAENILPKPTVEVTGAGQIENADPSLMPLHQENSSFIDTSELLPRPDVQIHHQFPPLTEEEISRGIKVFKPFNDTKGAISTFKAERIYNVMCLQHKLRHLYKCMGAKCSFTTISLKAFARHFDEHKEIYVMNADDDPHRGFWNVCAYCLTPHATRKDLCIHIRKEHGICTLQCSKCFYRAKSIANVHFHHTVEHVGEKFNALLCEQGEMNLPPFIEKPFTEFVSAFRCSLKESCSLFTYMLHTFCHHLKVAHPDDLRCHLCMDSYPNTKGLLQHYCERHGIGLFQCLFCTFGASTEHEIRLHLCYVHPGTDPKALQRTDNTLKQNIGLTNRESIKRLMFYKDQDKLMRYVTHPPTEPEPGTSSMSPPSGEPKPSASLPPAEPTPRFTRPAILRTKRPAGELSNQPKVLILSPPQSSGEGAMSVPVRVTPPSPLPPSGYSDVASSTITASTDTAPSTEPSDTTSTCSATTSVLDPDKSALAADRDTSTPESRVSNASTSNSNDNNSLSNSEAVDVNYFKCGNKECAFEASTSAPLKNHLVICDQARQSQKLSCVFCHRVFKQGASLVEHLRAHGPERYACSLCPFKASLLSRVNSHMKACHHVFTTTVVPLDPSKRDSETDYFIINGKEKRRGGEKPGPKGKARSEMKTKFSLEELEDVPKAAIFHNTLGCRLCSYGTKVRSNLVRHLQQHSAGDVVPQEEFVNPVPDKTEKMFDKMMNLAGSSHKKKPGPENSKDETAVGCMYKYVPDQDRYMCHIKECGYRTLSETMLRDHIVVIHKDETYYVCPHCIEEVDVVPIPIDQLSMHLKLHDSPVFKCAYCHFCSHIRRSIERHTEVLHPGEPVDAQAVRLTKPDNSEQPAPKFYRTDKSDEQGEEWYYCNHCVFKTKKKKLMLQHGVMEHKMAKPFKCSSCVYECLTEQIFRDHFNNFHPNKDCELIALYKKVTEVKKPVLPPIPPLWKRDAKRLKLIRGIKLDEKGDAPPPVVTATTGIEGLDVLELKFGHFGKPLGTNFMCPRCSTSFMCKNRQEMKEHLFKDLEYSPILCKICKIGSTQRTKVMKHINKVHNVEWDRISESLDINVNEELESWVENVLARQQSLMSEVAPSPAMEGEPPRKRRRSSVEAAGAPTLEPPSAELSDTESLDSDDKDDHKGREKRKRDKCPSRHRFSCEYCGVTTKYKHSIILHCKKVHLDLPPKVNTLDKTLEEKTDAYNCMYCNCTALNLNNLKHHWTHTHKNSGLNFLFRNTVFNTELEYECYWCKKRSDLESLEEHCRDDHSADQRFLVVSISVPKYKCSECNLVFKSVDLLKRHFSVSHPSKKFCYIVINTQRPVSPSDQSSPSSSSLPESPPKPKSSVTYKCFNCPYASPRFWPVVKHMHGHFVTFVCTECENWFPSSLGLNSHMLSKHPSSSAKPYILKGSETDIENAKKNIIVISESGVKRKITEEELAEAEKENKPEEEVIDMYTYDEPLEVHMSLPPVKETARKSTGSPKYRSTPPELLSSPLLHEIKKSPSRPKKALFKVRRKKLNLYNTFVTVKSHDKVIRLPAETFRRLVNFDAELKLKTNAT